MEHMSEAPAWIAMAFLGLTVLGMICGGITMAIKWAHAFGQQKARLDRAETDISELKEADREASDNSGTIKTVVALIERIEARMDNLERDIRRWFTRGDA